ncbi:response regulator [Pontibacterium granulatum]|uniref:response regulator n=1 Tax=Pontibacterium granulatum TaxID=2036029 RepID=UPI00249B77F4|nr:response regulator [Pontibacterium granulatum]MDI3323917.1 response regulator [Pontibacterium granulatum]
MLNRFKDITIRQRVLIVSLLPLLLITLLLGSYFIHNQLEDAETALRERGESMSHLMAAAAEFGLITDDKEMLASLIRHPNQDIDVADIVFLNSDFDVVLRADQYGSNIRRDQSYPWITDRYIYFLQPVMATGIDVLDSPEFSDTETGGNRPTQVGWVAVVMSRVHTQHRQQEIILKGITIALAGLLVTLYLAMRFGRRITTPLLKITDVVEQLERGHLNVRVQHQTTGELMTLSRGINRLAQRVQESNQTLESQVDKATNRLRKTLVHMERQNLALNAARKKADGANRTKDDFLARMSHELRTPLTSVLGFSRLLDETNLRPEQKEYTRIINQTSSLLLSIIDDILDFSKLQSNAIKLEKLPLNVDSLVSDIIEMQAPAAHSKGLELIPLLATDIPEELHGDPMRIRQILTNLVSNAIKFTEHGHVVIRVYLESQTEDTTTLMFEVEDTGVGIPKNRIRNLFQAFTQADNSITRKFGGSGLGLVIARLLSELMGGSIELESEEDQGTVVRIYLPLFCPQPQALPQTYHTNQVVIFDQHPLNRRNLKNQLNRLVPRPISVASCEEMLRRQASEKVGAIVWGLEPNATRSSAFAEELRMVCTQYQGPLILLACEPPELALPENIIVLRKPARTSNLLGALLPDQFSAPQDEYSEARVELPLHILVAEDNDFNRLLITRILEQAGAKVATCTNGEDAIRWAQKESFDLILMDVHMPKVDGIQATETIREQDRHTPIVALTANVIASEHQRLLHAGANKVLLKPINDQEVKTAINALTQKAPLAQTPVDVEPVSSSQMLEDYQISKDLLHSELLKQLEGLQAGFENRSPERMRHHSHQLLGLAGLYELPELEVVGIDLNRAIKQDDIRQTWDALWRLQRMIEHSQY